jgi:biopolymer transport protein ExbD
MGARIVSGAKGKMQPTVEPNVIPFIDVLLVLLIIFMITAPKPTVDLRLDLEHPRPSAAAMIPPTMVRLVEAPDGYRLFVDGEETTILEVSEVTLEHMLAVDRALTPEDAYADGRVRVYADLDVAYQNVVSVIDTLQQASFQKVVIAPQDADQS